MNKVAGGFALLWLVTAIASFVGWVTNIVELFTKHDTLWDIAIGIAGVPIAPLGAIRGLGHLFGAW